MAIGGYTPGASTGTGRNLNFSTWLKTFFLPAHEKMVFIPRIKEGGKPYALATMRTFDRFASTALTSTTISTNANLTWQAGTPSAATLTPAGYYIAVAYDDQMKDAVELDLNAPIRKSIESCAAEACDTVALAVASSLTNVVGDASTHVDLALLRGSIAQLRINSYGSVDVRDGALQGVFDPCTEPDLLSIPEMTQANYRGDGENPLVKGFASKGSGINWNYSTAVYAPAGGSHNVIFDPEAFLIMWNTHPTTEKQRDGLANLLISYSNFGIAVARNEKAICLKSLVSL
jgi:hypothetical protein